MSEPSGDRPAPAHAALSLHAHDRVGGRRTDEAWLAEVWRDPASRVLLLAGSTVAVGECDEGHRVAWAAPADVERDHPDGQRILLGERDGVVHLAWLLPDEARSRELAGARFEGLRAVVQTLLAEDAALVVHAVGIAEWMRAHRHCPRCGGRLRADGAGHVLRCADCGRQQFPRTDPAVIMLVIDGEAPHDRCLLGRQPSWPPGRYSTLAGFVEPGESFEQAVRREVAEETGVRVGEVTYRGNQPWPFPASLMVGFHARAETTDIEVDGEEIEHARWFTREEMLSEAESGALVLPGGVSISRTLVEEWYAGPLPGRW